MRDNIFEETVDFSEELYQKNIAENEFNEEEEYEMGEDENANN